MKKSLLLVCFAAFSIFAEEIIVNQGETRTISNRVFEDYSGDFVIKNYGTLILENCTFENNELGSKDNEAIFSSGRIAAPVVNFGDLSVSNSRFINNFSWNTALSDDFEAQAAAGAIANFGELELADNNVFENNSYQKGHFVVIRNTYIDQFAYLGNDEVFNAGNIEFTKTNQSLTHDEIDWQIQAALIKNPVRDNAEILIATNKPVNVKITILNALGNVMFSSQRHVQNPQEIIEWNLIDLTGKKVPSGAYSVRVEANHFVRVMQLGVQK